MHDESNALLMILNMPSKIMKSHRNFCVWVYNRGRHQKCHSQRTDFNKLPFIYLFVLPFWILFLFKYLTQFPIGFQAIIY